MNENEQNALLPAGLRDVLPNDAAFEAQIVEQIVTLFGQNGYDRVKAPLIEFEDSLLAGDGVALASQTFRLMDPVSQRMMGVRADITPQISRIARTRLGQTPRPIRLSYAGEVLRVRGSQLRPERQIMQVGAELIGSSTSLADTEIIELASDAIGSLGIHNFSVDLTVPRLVPSILNKFGLSGDVAVAVRAALDRKDPEAVESVAGAATPILVALLEASGPVDRALQQLKALSLPVTAEVERQQLEEVVGRLRVGMPDLHLTLDPAENRGFEYHTGIGFTIFARGMPGELARGGRYLVKGHSDVGSVEPATGVTLYVDTILGMLPQQNNARRVLVPLGVSRVTKSELHKAGWITVSSLDANADPASEAQHLACSHFLYGSDPRPVKG